MTTLQRLGSNLQEGRVALGLTQAQLARLLGRRFGDSVSPGAICQYEAGSREMPALRLLRLARVLHMDADELAGRSLRKE